MPRRDLRLSVTTLLALVAAVALNLWLFRLSWLAGLVGLNVSKHLAIAYVCQALGIDRRGRPGTRVGAHGPSR